MKHKHHDMICQWAADTSRKVQCRRPLGQWTTLDETPLWEPDFEYRFADSALRYRVALFNDHGANWVDVVRTEAAERSCEAAGNFVRWITDWTEVTEPVVEEPKPKPKTVKREAWLALTADGECAVFEDEVNARHFVINHGVECRHIEWEVPS